MLPSTKLLSVSQTTEVEVINVTPTVAVIVKTVVTVDNLAGVYLRTRIETIQVLGIPVAMTEKTDLGFVM
jgi:hypothetical protein